MSTVTNPQNKRSGYERDPLDYYVEAPWVTDALLAQMTPARPVWDPACGMGNVVARCQAHGIPARGTDVVWRPGADTTLDFLEGVAPWGQPGAIVTNPPYASATRFIRTALSLARGDVAMLVRLDFLATKTRRRLFRADPPTRVFILSQRPSMPPGDKLERGEIVPRGGQHDFCWIWWNAARGGEQGIDWIMAPEGAPA